MMTQNNPVVVGIDVAKDKVDACIRTVTERKTCRTTAAGQRGLIVWLRKHQVGKAVMEASGGYERVWVRALRQASRPTLHQRRAPLGPKCPLYALRRRSDAEQSGVQGLLSAPDCQGEGAKGRARRLYAQAARHPQHHDRPRREVGYETIPDALTSAPIMRSDLGRAHAKLKDRRTDGVKARASLETG
jgi:hypothetical protein